VRNTQNVNRRNQLAAVAYINRPTGADNIQSTETYEETKRESAIGTQGSSSWV